jgi:NAD(P)-dependent dehydrogenase (short-subunit alcohol dehydrogenase family)
MALAAEGARVMIADIAEGGDLAREISAKHGANSASSAFCDVSDEKAVKMAVATALDRFGKIDVLVNNAAVYSTLTEMPFTEIDVDTWDRVMDVNVRGMFLMSKYVAPVMMAQRSGKIINIGSGTALRGIPNMLHYVTSKGAVMAFTRGLSRELGEYGICVNTLTPGFTLSDSILSNNPAHVSSAREPAIQRRAIKRDERPQDLLGALVFLASSESDFITGQTIAVDGGAVNT